MRLVHRLLVLLVLCAVVGGFIGWRRSAGKPAAHGLLRSCVPDVQPLPASIERGMSYVHSWEGRGVHGYGTPTSLSSLRELRDLGTRWVSLMPFGFMGSLSATQVRLLPARGEGESDERLRLETKAVHGLGMKVLLKPHLWLRHGDWCGLINPGSAQGWGHWFDSYQTFILHYAQLAQETSADMLVIGVELCKSTSVAQGEQRWRELIAQVRKAYRGPLVYGANWDEVERVPFWDAMDYIGTEFYPPLADKPGSTEAAMAARLREELDKLQAVSRRVQRKVIFTEVGYKSVRGTVVNPHAWPEQMQEGDRVVSEEEQAQAYRVFFQGIRDRDFVRGVYPWKWFSYPNTDEEGPYGFSLRGKQAEAVLRSAYGGRCAGR